MSITAFSEFAGYLVRPNIPDSYLAHSIFCEYLTRYSQEKHFTFAAPLNADEYLTQAYIVGPAVEKMLLESYRISYEDIITSHDSSVRNRNPQNFPNVREYFDFTEEHWKQLVKCEHNPMHDSKFTQMLILYLLNMRSSFYEANLYEYRKFAYLLVGNEDEIKPFFDDRFVAIISQNTYKIICSTLANHYYNTLDSTLLYYISSTISARNIFHRTVNQDSNLEEYLVSFANSLLEHGKYISPSLKIYLQKLGYKVVKSDLDEIYNLLRSKEISKEIRNQIYDLLINSQNSA